MSDSFLGCGWWLQVLCVVSSSAAPRPRPAAAQASPRTRRELAPDPALAETRTRHFTLSHNWYLNLTPHTLTNILARPAASRRCHNSCLAQFAPEPSSDPDLGCQGLVTGYWARVCHCTPSSVSSVSAGLRGSPPPQPPGTGPTLTPLVSSFPRCRL